MSQGTAIDGVLEATWLIVADYLHSMKCDSGATPMLKNMLDTVQMSAYRQGKTDATNEQRPVMEASEAIHNDQKALYVTVLVAYLMNKIGLQELKIHLDRLALPPDLSDIEVHTDLDTKIITYRKTSNAQ